MASIDRLWAELSQLRVELRQISTQQIRSELTGAQTDINDIESQLLDGYLFGGTVYYTTSGTFDKADHPGLRAVRVEVQAAGGGGGGAGVTAAGEASAGGGGGAGGYAETLIEAASLASSETVTVGAGGAGGLGSVTNGDAGGGSSFGAHAVAAGGSPGDAGAIRTTPPSAGSAGGAGGSVSAGALQIPGGGGGIAIALVTRIPTAGGGAAALGHPTREFQTLLGTSGGAGSVYGSGGGGASNSESQGTAKAGGDGADGIVIVELYF